MLWWHMQGDPASWRVVANEARGDEWQSFDGCAVAVSYTHLTLPTILLV